MPLEMLLFYMVAFVTAASALSIVLSRSIVRSALSLLLTLIGVSLIYFLLGAEFLGAAQLMIYVGGTLVLVVFGGMLTSQGPYAGIRPTRLDWLLGGTLAGMLFVAIVMISLDFTAPSPSSDHPLPGAGPIGLGFLGIPSKPDASSYLLPFEFVSVHLLVVLIGAAYLARARRRSEEVPHG